MNCLKSQINQLSEHGNKDVSFYLVKEQNQMNWWKVQNNINISYTTLYFSLIQYISYVKVLLKVESV